jgi:mono/diheme cytochrome c family protein
MRCAGLLILAGASLLAQPTPGRSVFADLPDEARTKINPQAEDRGTLVEGRKLFLRNCAPCHGADAGGGIGTINRLDGRLLYQVLTTSRQHGKEVLLEFASAELGRTVLPEELSWIEVPWVPGVE